MGWSECGCYKVHMTTFQWTTRRPLRPYLTGGDVAATDQLRQLGRLGRTENGLRSHQGDVAATAETDQSRRLGRPKYGLRSHVAETSPRPAGDWKSLPPPKKKTNWTCLNFSRLPGDPASLYETSWRRLRNQRRLESPPSLQASEMGPLTAM